MLETGRPATSLDDMMYVSKAQAAEDLLREALWMVC